MEMYLLSIVIFVVLLIGLAGWMISASERSQKKRKDEIETRRMQRQPWDVEGSR